MRKKPTISVIMPVYNTPSDYLRAAIDSILGQTFTDFEFIIINDGSTDERVERTIKSYSDRRIRYIRKENSGITRTLLHGLKVARGEFIARMDGDDISLPERFALQVEFLRANPDVGLVGGWLQTMPPHGDPDIWQYMAEPRLMDVCRGNPVGHPVVMWRRELFEKYDLCYDPKYPFAQDYELWSRAIRFVKFANIQQVLLKYRIGNHNISHNHHNDQAAIDIRVKRNMLDFFSADEYVQTKIWELLSGNARLPELMPLPNANIKSSDLRPLAPWMGRIICCVIPSRDARHAFRSKYVRK